MSEPNRNSNRSDNGLGLITLSALVVANMIGAGVFTSSGYSLGALGNPGRVMLAWWLCGAWAIAGAIAYGALARRLPLSGGEYLFLSRLVHPAVGFLAGWISVVAGFTAPIAVAAQGAAIYGLGQVDSGDWRLTFVAVAVIVFATACHLIGVSLGTGLQNAIVAAKLLLLAIIIVWAFAFTAPEVWQGEALPDQSSAWWPEDWNAWTVLVGSMSWVALSYTGFNAAIYVAGQARQPQRTVPLSMIVATIAVTVIYLLLNYVFVYAPAPEAIVNQNNVASIAAEAVGGAGLSWLVRITIVLSMASSVFAMLLAGPRVYQKMADDGVMPRLFRSAGDTPRLATVAQAALSIVAVFMADLLQLMKYLGLTLSACGALAVASLWWARHRLPTAKPLRWWETLSVVVYLLITLAILWASRDTHSDEFTAMLVTFGLGLLVYLISVFQETFIRKTTPRNQCGPYQLEQRISGSGDCEVYLARKPHSPQPIVVKLLPATKLTPLNQQRHERERLLLSAQDSPHIARFVDAGSSVDGALYLAVEHVAGETLWEVVKRDGAIAQQRALPLLQQIAATVSTLHTSGYVHGDLAPKNIIVTGPASYVTWPREKGVSAKLAEQITLIDLALARPIHSQLNSGETLAEQRELPGNSSIEEKKKQSACGDTASSLPIVNGLESPATLLSIDASSSSNDQSSADKTMSGTPAFMSPECCQGAGGDRELLNAPATDIYSFGCLAFFMLSGQLPLSGATSIEICWKQVHQSAPPLRSLVTTKLDAKLEELVMSCLQKQPEQRPSSMAVIAATLQSIISEYDNS